MSVTALESQNRGLFSGTSYVLHVNPICWIICCMVTSETGVQMREKGIIYYSHDRFNFNIYEGTVLRTGKYVRLTRNEQNLLLLMAVNQNLVVLYEVIAQAIWVYPLDMRGKHYTQGVMRGLRIKIGDVDKNKPIIQTIHNVGYMIKNQRDK